jgi:hypothetical protein
MSPPANPVPRRQPRSPFKAALIGLSKESTVSDDDRAHLKKWIASEGTDGVVLDRLVSDARDCGVWPSDSVYRTVVRDALEARRIAAAAWLGDDPIPREAAAAMSCWRSPTRRRTSPDTIEPSSNTLASRCSLSGFFAVRRLWLLHQCEAGLLRYRAEREPMATTLSRF